MDMEFLVIYDTMITKNDIWVIPIINTISLIPSLGNLLDVAL